MIKLNNISKSFIGDQVETVAINNMSLEIKKGEFVSILGPSGCGKSTLLNVLGMLDHINQGDFVFADHDIGKASEQRRAQLRKEHIGFIFQSFNLIDELNVEQNIELPLYYHKVPKKERTQRVAEALKRVDIEHRRHHLPAKLSGGQQQRVAIARALVTNPSLILADEPTGNLDSANSTQVMELLQALNQQGTTIIMVTHAPEHVCYGTRVIELLDGKIQQDIGVEHIPSSFTPSKETSQQTEVAYD